MTVRVAINGFGRIGRLVLRHISDNPALQVVAVNDLIDAKYAAYLLQYDSTHRRFPQEIIYQEPSTLIVNGQPVQFLQSADPKDLPWDSLQVDVVIESTGRFLTQATAGEHLAAGAKKVIITAPAKEAGIPTFVMGVNHSTYAGESIVSNASCTTNCLAPLVKAVDTAFGLMEGLMTTVHATTATQKTVDGVSQRDWRGGRGALQNIIPSTTGAAKAVTLVLPHLVGKLTGIAFRVPTPDVSVVDLTCRLKHATSYEALCEKIREASQNELKGILAYTESAVVSTDFTGNTHTCIFDATAGLALNDQFFKLIAWYDNEYAYSHKVTQLAEYITQP